MVAFVGYSRVHRGQELLVLPALGSVGSSSCLHGSEEGQHVPVVGRTQTCHRKLLAVRELPGLSCFLATVGIEFGSTKSSHQLS